MRHSSAHRAEAGATVDRLKRWWLAGHPRRVSADVAALALTASAAMDLVVGDAELDRAAAAAVADMTSREPSAAPALHLALAAWALDRVIPDRFSAPWAGIRKHIGLAHHSRGLDAPLRTFTRALADPGTDPVTLARDLLTQTPTSPGLEDAAAVLWLLTVSIEHLNNRLSHGDSGFGALVDRRAELARRLAEELDERSFSEPEVSDFADSGEVDLRPIVYVSPLEALLIDMSLASSEPAASWLRFEEAQALFGQRERDARSSLARRTGLFLWLIGVLGAAVTVTTLGWTGAEHDIMVPAALLAIGLLGTAATAVLDRWRSGKRTVAAGMLTITATLVAAVMTVNEALRHPFLPNLSAFAVGALVGAVATYAHALLFPDERPETSSVDVTS